MKLQEIFNNYYYEKRIIKVKKTFENTTINV